MAKTHESIWDGEFIRSVTIAVANAMQAAGTAQIWKGVQGYMPGWQMKDSKEFPFAVVPPLVASAPAKKATSKIVVAPKDENK